MIIKIGHILCYVLVFFSLIPFVIPFIFASFASTVDRFFVASTKIIPIRPP